MTDGVEDTIPYLHQEYRLFPTDDLNRDHEYTQRGASRSDFTEQSQGPMATLENGIRFSGQLTSLIRSQAQKVCSWP